MADKKDSDNKATSEQGGVHFKQSQTQNTAQQQSPSHTKTSFGRVSSGVVPIPRAQSNSNHKNSRIKSPGSHKSPDGPDSRKSSNNEDLLRVKKKKSKTLKYVGIALGSLIALVLVFVTIFAMWFSSLDSSISIDDETELAELQEELTPVSSTDEAFYVLILGSDAREADTTSRSDVIMLARIDPSEGTISLVSIPRDTMVTINGSTVKINAAYAYGGAALAVSTVSEFAGVPIAHYVSLHFEELEEIVDMLGGVWVDIPEDIAAGNGGMSFSAGEQLLSGEEALAYVRERYTVSGGDFGRAQAQRQVAEAIITQVLESSPLELPSLISQLASCISTDLSLSEIITYAQAFMGVDLTVYSAICPSYALNVDGVSYVATMFDEWRRMMQLTDAGLDPNSETDEIPDEQAENEDLGSAANSPAPTDYEALAASAMTTDDVASTD